MTGIDIGLKNRVVEGRGLALGLVGIEGEASLSGIHVSGLGTVSEGDIGGLGLGGLAVVSGADLDGIHAGGLAVVSGASQSGLSVAGLACVSGADLSGIALSGLATVAGGDIDGLASALLATRDDNLNGVAFSGYNRVDGRQTGLSVGVFNCAHSLYGVQIGLLNYVKENPVWLRWLPIVDARF